MRGLSLNCDVEVTLNGISYYMVGSVDVECAHDGSNPVIEAVNLDINDMMDGSTSYEVIGLQSGPMFDAVVASLEASEWFALKVYEACK